MVNKERMINSNNMIEIIKPICAIGLPFTLFFTNILNHQTKRTRTWVYRDEADANPKKMTPEEIYDRYGEKMYQYLALRLGSPQDAEDILQETFCRLARYSLRWRFLRNPKAFVFRVLRNEFCRHLRRRINEPKTGRYSPDPDDVIAPAVFDGPDERTIRLVSRALSDLPEDQREVIILKIYQGLSFREIAAICGSSVNTAASRYRYALAKLRRHLEVEAKK
jgi:RNA polymerase sigma-70 factor (ECF subfamily)